MKTIGKILVYTNPLVWPVLFGAGIAVMAHNFVKAARIFDQEVVDGKR